MALISDMHGNAVALKAALDDLANHPADYTLCMGDAVQGGCEPLRIVEILAELACPVVMGNSDSFILDNEASHEVTGPTHEVAEWTRAQLGKDGLAFVSTFTPTVSLDLGGGRSLLGFHGSPRSFDEVLLPETPEEEFAALIGPADQAVLVGGHTHLQWTRRFGESLFLNPGSVGVAYNRYMTPETFYIYPQAEYAVLHVEPNSIRIEYCRVPFDVDEMERAALASGRPFADSEAPRYRPRPKADD